MDVFYGEFYHSGIECLHAETGKVTFGTIKILMKLF